MTDKQTVVLAQEEGSVRTLLCSAEWVPWREKVPWMEKAFRTLEKLIPSALRWKSLTSVYWLKISTVSQRTAQC